MSETPRTDHVWSIINVYGPADRVVKMLESHKQIETELTASEAARREAEKQCNDYREDSERMAAYIRQLGTLLGCADGDDLPEQRIAALKATVEGLEGDRERLMIIESMLDDSSLLHPVSIFVEDGGVIIDAPIEWAKRHKRTEVFVEDSLDAALDAARAAQTGGEKV